MIILTEDLIFRYFSKVSVLSLMNQIQFEQLVIIRTNAKVLDEKSIFVRGIGCTKQN
jgi:hypothetical protein